MRARGAGLVACAMLAACGAAQEAARPAPVGPRASVRVAAASCPARQAAEARLARVLADHRAEQSDLFVEVSASPRHDGGSDLHLRVVRENGDVGLDRRYVLAPGDCDSAADLLALSVDRFLSSFPEWAGPAPTVGSIAPPSPRWIELLATSTMSGIVRPLGAEGQIGLLADLGGAGHRFGASALVRASLPQSAGTGQFQQTALLAGAVWRRRWSPWEVRAELRGGAIRVTGSGFDQNDSDWLYWWEGATFAGRGFSWGSLGLEIAASPLRHRAVTRDHLVSEDIPLLRVGLAGSFELVSRKP